MKPGKRLRHLKTKHPQLVGKSITFFERISMTFKDEQSSFQKCFLANKSVVKAFYIVALQVAKCKKPYSITKKLIKPCLVLVCMELLGSLAADKMKTSSLLNDTIQRRISELSVDIEYQVIQKVTKFILKFN